MEKNGTCTRRFVNESPTIDDSQLMPDNPSLSEKLPGKRFMTDPASSLLKKRSARWRMLAGAAALLFASVMGLALWVFWPRNLIISPETTVITGPLTQDGRPDYGRYLNEKISAGLTPENNAAAVLYRVVDPSSVPAEIRQRFYQRLGIQQPNPGEFVQYSRALAQISIDGNPWVNANTAQLQVLESAKEMTRAYIPLLSNDEHSTIQGMQLAETQGIETVLQLLRTRANLRLKSNEVDGAIDDALLLHRLGRMLTQTGMHECRYVWFSLISHPEDPLRALILSGQLNLGQIRKLRGGLRDLPPVDGMEVEGELARFMRISLVTESWRHGNNYARLPFAADPNSLLRLWNVHFDRDLNNYKLRDPAELIAAMEQHAIVIREQREKMQLNWLARKLMELRKKYAPLSQSGVPAKLIDHLYVIEEVRPSYGYAVYHDRAAAQVDMLNLGAAIVEHQVRTGALPRTLDDLVPEELDAVPIDPWTKKPFSYRVAGEKFEVSTHRDYPTIEVSAKPITGVRPTDISFGPRE